jgi:hypothetical protein
MDISISIRNGKKKWGFKGMLFAESYPGKPCFNLLRDFLWIYM